MIFQPETLEDAAAIVSAVLSNAQESILADRPVEVPKDLGRVVSWALKAIELHVRLEPSTTVDTHNPAPE